MKRLFGLFLLAVLLMTTTGCTDDLLRKLDELDARIEDLERLCDQLNSDLGSLRSLVETLQSQDMITGISEIRDANGSLVSYKINFVTHEPITITNGKDGTVPMIASRMNPEDKNWYWSIEYGDGTSDWLRAADGTMMLSIGILPYVTVRDGSFLFTVDGVEWIDLGKADGVDGDRMFKAIDLSDKDFVVITLTNGEVLKIPTYDAYKRLKDEFDKINQNTDAQVSLLQARKEHLAWITSVVPIVSEGDTTGLTVSLSNGKTFSIHDWTSSLSPDIFFKEASDDCLYWAYSLGGSGDHWVLSSDGLRVPASSDSVSVPRVSVTRDKDGEYYWTVTVDGETEFLRTAVGKEWAPHAIDSVTRIFSEVRNYTDSLVVVLKDGGTRFVLPKQYTVSFTELDGKAVGSSIAMGVSQTRRLRYTANGTDVSLTLVQQGGFKVSQTTLEDGTSGIEITSPLDFTSNKARVTAIFTFPTESSPVTIVKTITITKQN